jgi:hypothetical protein
MMTGEVLRFQCSDGSDPTLAEVLDPEERVLVSGDAFVQCSSEDDDLYKYRRRNFLRAAAAWLESLGWTAPTRAVRRLERA